jgi:4-amino-4-deoxy-L-arabinose transferase-like glycosyltransferase
MPRRALALVIAAKSLLDLAFAGRYGWQRDELYYAVAGRHLQAGYVEFPPVTGLLSALARTLFGYSLIGFRLFPIAAGALVMLIAALVAHELGGSARAQVLAAVLVGFTPLMVATNGLFQPVSFDQLATMLCLWLALRIALGHGSWPLLGLAAGVGLETKYTLAVVLVLLVAGLAIWRRDLLLTRGFALAVGIALVLFLPNLIWEARHDWVSVRFFANPQGSATDETRPQYVINVLILTHIVAVPVAVAGVLALWRERSLRPFAFTVAGTVVAYLVLGGKSYYALPAVLFALAAGCLPLDRWATARRLRVVGTAYVVLLLVLLPDGVPVLPLRTADHLGVIKARSDYQDEVGWVAMAHAVEAQAQGADVALTGNYGEAGALDLFGRGLPPVATSDVTFREWRPAVTGRAPLLVGITQAQATFCRGYRVVARVQMPVANYERGQPIARCTLTGSLQQIWPQMLALNPL